MKYKTITLELLQQHPALHERLCRSHTLLATLERLAHDLKRRHEALKAQLAQTMPERDPLPIGSEAMEIAVRELEEALLDE